MTVIKNLCTIEAVTSNLDLDSSVNIAIVAHQTSIHF